MKYANYGRYMYVRMTAVSAFNDLMQTFLEELSKISPGDTECLAALEAFTLAKKSNARLPLQKFMEVCQPKLESIVNKEDSFFEMKIEGLPDMSAKWKKLSESNKECVWAYIQQLAMLGNGILTIPENVMQNVEKMADALANDQGVDDISGLFQKLQGQLEAKK